MIVHYLKAALRSLLKKKLYTSINIIGLAVGLAMCLVVAGHVFHEMGFENFQENRNRIHRVEATYEAADEQRNWAKVMGPLGRAAVDEIPEVEDAAVFRVEELTSVTIGEERTRVVNEYQGAGYAHGNKLIFANPSYLNVFTFPLLKGDAATALADPYSVLLTEAAAEKYFESKDPIGRTIVLNDSLNCMVSGLLKDIPQNTQLFCEFVVSYSTLASAGHDVDSWDNIGRDYVYLLISESANPRALPGKISSVASTYIEPEEAPKYTFGTQALPDIYFNSFFSGKWGELRPGGEISLMYEIGVVALFILLQAIANFVNLSTARSADRMKEVGVRKVFGASRSQLVRQYIGESMIVTGAATLIAVALYEAFKFKVTGFLPREQLVDFYADPGMLLSVIGLTLLVGVLGGFYPALYLSRFRPIAILQSKVAAKSSRSLLRKSLVVVQFGIAALFTFCTLTIIRQTSYVTSMDVGFDTENILIMDLEGENAAENCALMKNEVLLKNRVVSATASNCPPGRQSYHGYGYFKDEQRLEEDLFVTRTFEVDYDFASLFGLQLVEGRGFTPGDQGGGGIPIIVTEAAVEELGLNSAVGHKLYSSGDASYEIIGVVKDFHGSPLTYGYNASIVLRIVPDHYNNLAVKLPSDDIEGSIAALRDTWEATLPGFAFNYTFLDDEIDAGYSENRGQGRVAAVLSIVTIAIACLGIFGLVSYTAEQRTREIGIRKVLGASVPGIVKMLSKEFVILIIIANIIAQPLGYLAMSNMLDWVPFRVEMGVGTFVSVLAVGLLFALGTASFQSIKAALANPIDSLRNE